MDQVGCRGASNRSWAMNLLSLFDSRQPSCLIFLMVLVLSYVLLLLDGWSNWKRGGVPEHMLKDDDPACSFLTWVKQLEWRVAMVLGRNLGGGFQWGTPLGEFYAESIYDDGV